MKKILAVVLALAMVMALSLSVSAIEGSQDVVLCVQDNVSWQTHVSDPVTIDGAGVYTVSISGLNFDSSAVTVIYVKDATAVAEGDNFTGTSGISGLSIYTKSLKINGAEVALRDGYATGLTDAGVFDVCWVNIWAETFADLPAGTINDIEVVLEITDEGAAPSADAAAPVEDGTAADNNTVEPAATAPAATTSEAPKTGIAIAVVPAVMALAAVAVTKKH